MSHFRIALLALLSWVFVVSPACDCGSAPGEDGAPLGDGFVAVFALDETHVSLELSRALNADSATSDAFRIVDFTQLPSVESTVKSVEVVSDTKLTLQCDALLPGRTYTLIVDELLDTDGFSISGSLNFTASGGGEALEVEVSVLDVETARAHDDLVLLATVDPGTGAFQERLEVFPLRDEGDRFVARFPVQTDPNRTLDRGDDNDPSVDRRAYAMRLIDAVGRPVSPLQLFTLEDVAATRQFELPVLPPPEIVVPVGPEEPLPAPPVDDSPEDGVKLVRIVVDDRASQDLVSPELRLSFDEAGVFDASFPRSVPLTQIEGEPSGYLEAVVGVKVDANRIEEGQTEETFPYFAYLVSDGVEYESLSISVVAPDEIAETKRLVLGNAEWIPVTFRVDVSKAYVTPDGSVRGMYPDEAIFLTGAWQVAVDALGNNCGDSFSGGESLNLRMKEDADHPGVWTRTLWLPPGRPYGWKAVRCHAENGCGPLNQLVSSSGNAFATVMKNLTTDNVDAFADPSVALVDPLAPETTEAGGQTYDYTDAVIYEGTGVGSEPDPAGTPDGLRMFKQEVPDLVVVVGEQPVKTRIFHVGTWRDINLEETPQEIIDASSVVELGPLDYDDFFTGRYPPSREAP